MNRLLFFIAVLLLAATAQGQVYKCIGADGRVVYSQDKCPPTAKSATVGGGTVPPVATPVPADAAGTATKGGDTKKLTPEQDFQKRQQEKTDAQKKEQEALAKAKEKEENCRRARENMTGLQTGRVARYNSSGDRYFLDDDQIAQEKSRTQSVIDQSCN
jgi:Domain of unknown function (DUF4124)